MLLEVGPWAFDRYVGRYDYAFISTDTVRENFRRGFGFDSDTFAQRLLEEAHRLAVGAAVGATVGGTPPSAASVSCQDSYHG